MMETLLGVILGGLVSWMLTHWYYRKAEKNAFAQNPIPLLESLQQELNIIRGAIANPGNMSQVQLSMVQEAIARIEGLFEMLAHSHSVNLQGILSLIELLQLQHDAKDSRAVDETITRLSELMEETAESYKQGREVVSNTISETTQLTKNE